MSQGAVALHRIAFLTTGVATVIVFTAAKVPPGAFALSSAMKESIALSPPAATAASAALPLSAGALESTCTVYATLMPTTLERCRRRWWRWR
jgi:hypothetical protein